MQHGSLTTRLAPAARSVGPVVRLTSQSPTADTAYGLMGSICHRRHVDPIPNTALGPHCILADGDLGGRRVAHPLRVDLLAVLKKKKLHLMHDDHSTSEYRAVRYSTCAQRGGSMINNTRKKEGMSCELVILSLSC
jgi:hypothetical protein